MPAREPAELSQMFKEAANRADIDELLDLYEPDVAFAESPTGAVGRGGAALRTHLEGLLAARPTFGQMAVTKVFDAGEIALVCSEWTATASDPSGNPVTMTGRGTEVSRRQADGSWRLVVDNPWGTG